MGFNLGRALGGGAIGSVIGLPGTIAGTIIGGSKKDGGGAGAGAMPAPMTPAEAAAARQADLDKGQQRFKDLMAGNAGVQDVLKRRQDGLQGLNSQEMTAAREQMVRGSQAANQGIMRQLLAQQQKSGIRGGLASGQQMNMASNFAAQRADQERKLLTDNYAIKDKAMDKYQDVTMGQAYGELAQGANEAGLGVADRTGYQQALIGQQMAAAAGKEPRKGLLTSVFGGLI